MTITTDQYCLLSALAEEGHADTDYELGHYFFGGAHTGKPQYWKQKLEECGVSTDDLYECDFGYAIKVDHDNNTMIIPYEEEEMK